MERCISLSLVFLGIIFPFAGRAIGAGLAYNEVAFLSGKTGFLSLGKRPRFERLLTTRNHG